MNKLRQDDEVIVITGKDKGKRGTISRIIGNDKLIVAGVNMVKRHTRPNPNLGQAGGIIEKEAPLTYRILLFLMRLRISQIALVLKCWKMARRSESSNQMVKI